MRRRRRHLRVVRPGQRPPGERRRDVVTALVLVAAFVALVLWRVGLPSPP